jgi:hypothetical protein
MLILTTNLQAQETIFSLADYKNPEYFYQSLNLVFDENNSFSYHRQDQEYLMKNTTNGGNLGLNAHYIKFINSPERQVEGSADINLGMGNSLSDAKNDASTTKLQTLSMMGSLGLAESRRFYRTSGNFLEIGADLAIFTQNNFSNQKYTNINFNGTQENKKRTTLATQTITVSLLTGRGRIEQVQDARLAFFILDDLTRSGKLARQATQEDWLQLSGLITRLKYKRFFDTRLRKIAEITAIDSIFQANGLKKDSDAAYFTTITDNWNYSNNPVRNNGNRLFAGIEPSVSNTFNNNYEKEENLSVTEEHYRNNDFTLGCMAVLGYLSEKPLSMKWQRSAGVKAAVGGKQVFHSTNYIEPEMDDEKTYDYILPLLQLDASYGVGFYPNSRTWFTAKWWLSGGYCIAGNGVEPDEQHRSENDFYFYTGPQFNAYFYISEKLRLNVTYNGELRQDIVNYENEYQSNMNNFWLNQSARVIITYALF